MVQKQNVKKQFCPFREKDKKAIISKHLKGQLDPPVRDVTFLDQRRSVGPPVRDLTFLDHRSSVGSLCP